MNLGREKMKTIKVMLATSLLLIAFQGIVFSAAADESGTLLNLMIDMEQSSQAAEQPPAVGRMLEVNSTINLTNELDPRGLNFTIYVIGEIADQTYPLYVTLLGSKTNHELALAGMSTGESLVSLSDQETRIRRAKRYIENDYVCGGRQFKVEGYKPQPDSVNESTYQLLDNLGIKYLVDDFGLVESDEFWPYQMNNYSFYLVPISRSNGAILSDRIAKQEGINASQWYDLLVKASEDAKAKGEPLSVVFTNTVSGSDDYLNSFRKFVEYSVDNGAQFLTTTELVERVKSSAPQN
jgi:hypothetical protein